MKRMQIKKLLVLTVLLAAGVVRADHYYWRGNFYGGDGVTWDVANTNNFMWMQKPGGIGSAAFLPDADDHVIVDESWANSGGGTFPTISTNVGTIAYLTPGWSHDSGVASVTIEDGGSINALTKYWLGHGSNTVSIIYMTGGYMVGPELVLSNVGAGYVDMSGDSVLHLSNLVLGSAEGRIRMRGNAWFLVNGDHTATGSGYAANFINDGTITGLGTIVASYNSVDGRTEFVVTDPVTPEYVFFDGFNTSDADHANAGFLDRQAAATVVSPYSVSPRSFSISSNRLHGAVNGAGLKVGLDLADHIIGKDFDFSVKVANKETGSDWGSVYLYSDESPGRGNSHIGCLIWGAAQGTAYSLYDGIGPNQETTYGVSVQALVDEFGSWSAADEHTLLFISHPGSGETNTYDFVVDGVTMVSGIPYRIPGVTRKIGLIGIPKALGLYYDDLYLKVLKGITYEDWVVEDTDLIEGVNAARTDDPDADTMDNLLEYALGGNPLVDDAATFLPTSEFTSDAIEYVYRRRVDASTRGLVYDVVGNTNGLQFSWTNYETNFETNAVPINFAFESVTNVLPVTGLPFGFVNLEVTEQ